MNTKELIEGNKISVEFISNLNVDSRVGVIVENEDAEGKFGKYPKMTVEIAGKKKTWNMNLYSCEEWGKVHGFESSLYVGKKVSFSIVTKKSLPTILGIPVVEVDK
jgi:hypothetical protein